MASWMTVAVALIKLPNQDILVRQPQSHIWVRTKFKHCIELLIKNGRCQRHLVIINNLYQIVTTPFTLKSQKCIYFDRPSYCCWISFPISICHPVFPLYISSHRGFWGTCGWHTDKSPKKIHRGLQCIDIDDELNCLWRKITKQRYLVGDVLTI